MLKSALSPGPYTFGRRSTTAGNNTVVFNDGAAGVYGGDFSSLAVGMRHNF